MHPNKNNGNEPDTYIPVTEEEMTLEEYPCGLKAGTYIMPINDIPSFDETGNIDGIYLKANTRCVVLTGNPREPDVVWMRNCATSKIKVWNDPRPIMELFCPAPPKMELTEEYLLGKKILVGLTYCDKEGNEQRFEDHCGIITAVGENMLYIEEPDGKEITIPFDSDAIHEADKEATFNSSTGLSASGLDFISTWCIYPPEE